MYKTVSWTRSKMTFLRIWITPASFRVDMRACVALKAIHHLRPRLLQGPQMFLHRHQHLRIQSRHLLVVESVVWVRSRFQELWVDELRILKLGLGWRLCWGQRALRKLLFLVSNAKNSTRMSLHLKYIDFFREARSGQYCGGVLISEYHVLTASHCVDGWENRVKNSIVNLGEVTNPYISCNLSLVLKPRICESGWENTTLTGETTQLQEITVWLPLRCTKIIIGNKYLQNSQEKRKAF